MSNLPANVTPMGGDDPAAADGCACPLPPVQIALARVMREVKAVGKAGEMSPNAGGYRYRKVDDLYDAASDALARHGVIVVPHVAERWRTARGNETHVEVRMVLTVIGPAGDSFEYEHYGEGMDRRDRATSKAGTDAHKFALLRMLMVKVGDRNDAEARNDDPLRPSGGDPLDHPLVEVAIDAARLRGAGVLTIEQERVAVQFAAEGPDECARTLTALRDREIAHHRAAHDDEGDDPADDQADGDTDGGEPDDDGDPGGTDGAPAAVAVAHPSAGEQVNPGSDGRADRFYRQPDDEPAATAAAPNEHELRHEPDTVIPAGSPDGGPDREPAPRGVQAGLDGFTVDQRGQLDAAGITAQQRNTLANIVSVGRVSAPHALSFDEREQLVRIVERIQTGDVNIAGGRLVDPSSEPVDPWRLP